MSDFPDFKRAMLSLVSSFDRDKTTQADIESIMDTKFEPDAGAETFVMKSSEDAKAAKTYKSLNVVQLIEQCHLKKDTSEKSLCYSAESTEIIYAGQKIPFKTDLDGCLSLTALKASFFSEDGWHYAQSSMFYPGVVGSRHGAQLFAFVEPDTMKMEDPEAFAQLSADPQLASDQNKMRALNEMKSHIDGCVFLLMLR